MRATSCTSRSMPTKPPLQSGVRLSGKPLLGTSLRFFRKAVVAVLDRAPRELPPDVARDRDDALPQALQCDICAAVFDSSQALSVHAFRAHGTRTAARNHIDTTHCTRCMMQYWTRQRHLDHLRRNARCAAHALQMPRLSDTAVAALDLEARELTRANLRAGRHRNWAATPSVVLYGPRPPEA